MSGISNSFKFDIMRNVNFCLFISLFCMFFSCSDWTENSIKAEKYDKYFSSNISKFTIEKEYGDVIVAITYLPPELFTAHEIAFDTMLIIDSVKIKYRRTLCFRVEARARNNHISSPLLFANGQDGYSASVYKNTFDRDKDFYILSGKDTLPVAGYSLERSWGVNNGDALVLTFNKEALNGKISAGRLVLRNLISNLETIDIKLSDVVKPVPGVKR